MITQNQFLSEIYRIVKASAIDGLNGEVYIKTRPSDSELEDCVINCITGANGKLLQDGLLLIRVYYKDVFSNNSYYEDLAKGSAMENLLLDLSKALIDSVDFTFYPDTRETYTERAQEVQQHYAILRIKYKILVQ